MRRWRGDPDPDHVKAVDAYWVSAAEHGMNASTFTARVIASTGADVAAALSGAVGALSGPLHGGAPSRVLQMLDEVEKEGDAERWVKRAMDNGDRLMGFGHRVYRAEDPRARVLRRTAKELKSPRVQVAEALEQAALAELKARYPDRVLGHQRRVLVGGGARLRRGAGTHVHGDVRLRPHRRLERAHPRAEAHRQVDPPVGGLHRAGVAPALCRRWPYHVIDRGPIGLLGGGVIGGGWAARFLLNGHDVVMFDPDPEAPRKVGEVMANARRAYAKLTMAQWPTEGTLRIVTTVEEAVDGATFVQESAPERLELKQQLLATASRVAGPDVVFGSSTSGFYPRRCSATCCTLNGWWSGTRSTRCT